MIDPTTLSFGKMSGLLPAIIQDATTRQVLMLGYMNREALEKTFTEGRVHFWSRSKNRLWLKGETSGHFLQVVDIAVDCDNDALLVLVNPHGPTCHLGNVRCFVFQDDGDKNDNPDLLFLNYLFKLLQERKINPTVGSYTSQLFSEGLGKILMKIAEESDEVILAAEQESQQRLVEESCDLLYHLLVLLVEKNILLDHLMEELKRRHTFGCHLERSEGSSLRSG